MIKGRIFGAVCLPAVKQRSRLWNVTLEEPLPARGSMPNLCRYGLTLFVLGLTLVFFFERSAGKSHWTIKAQESTPVKETSTSPTALGKHQILEREI